MQRKEEVSNETKGEDSLRYKLLSLFTTSLSYEGPSLSILQIVLEIFNYIQILKFSVDYFGSYWFNTLTPVFLYLDPAFYSKFLSSSGYQSLLLVGVIIMNLYWITHLLIFLIGIEYSLLMKLIRKINFLFVRHLLFVPLFSLLLGMYSCSENSQFRGCYDQIPTIYQFGYIASFLLFSLFIGMQTYFNFQFLPHPKHYTRLKKSSHIPIVFFIYFMINEIAVLAYNDTGQLAILNIITFFLLGIVLWKEEQIDEIPRLIQLSGISTTLLGLLMLDLMMILGYKVEIWVFLLLAVGVVGGIMQTRTYSLKFQLQNINKWPTPDIMMRYASTMRYYVSRGKQFIFEVYIHGYMEIHRQKCDNVTCPSRSTLSDYDKKALEAMENGNQGQQLIRTHNIIKTIYEAGYKLNPISSELQLDNCIFLYQRMETDLALRRLLQIKYEELTYDKYHSYCLFKKLLEENITNNKSRQFLDLVTQRNLKKKEDEIIVLFQKVSLINLQFWSLLNDDHPDFQKLNQIGIERVRGGVQVQKSFQIISGWAHSERVVTLYANYLQCLQNDEKIVTDIYKSLIERYKLREKVVVQDWGNSSSNTLLVSLQQSTFGKIIDLNTCCSTLFGYQRHELLNQSTTILYPDQINQQVKHFLFTETNDMHFLLSHKSGYLIHLKKTSKNYNSMQNGLTALLTIVQQPSPYSCHFIVDKNSKIIASTASLLSLLNIDLKSYEGQTFVSLFFNFTYSNLPKSNQTYSKGQLLKSQFIHKDKISNESYQLIHQQRYGCKFIEIRRLLFIAKNARAAPSRGSSFQFQVDATLSNVRYIGSVDNQETFVSQFSHIQVSNELKDSNLKSSFAQGISTLRLRDNVVQLIEEGQKIESQQFIRKDSSVVGSLQVIPRQDEQQIFQSKQSYKQFLKSYKIGGIILWVLIAAVGFVILLYIITFVIENNINNSMLTYSKQIVYQNLIIGCIAKTSVFIVDMRLLVLNLSTDTPARLISSYNDNLLYLQQIQLLGSNPFSITINISGQTYVLLTSQYILTFINYANVLSDNLANATTLDQFSAAFNSTDPYTIQYLLTGQTVKDTLMSAYVGRQNEISNYVNRGQSIQAALTSVGVILTVAIGVVLVLWFHSLNKQKIKVLEIFLFVSEAQIQHFSSITERFLISIHSEQNAQLQEDMDSIRKIHSSSFPKKKSFKLIQFNKLLYIKLAFIPALMTAFFFHIYSISHSSTMFQAISVNYFALTSQANYYISVGQFKLSAAQASNTKIVPTTVSQPIRLYYRSFLDLNQDSFGTIANYHNTSCLILFQDICNGANTPYGFVSIPESCDLPLLYPNGTFLILDDYLKEIYWWDQTELLTYEHHIQVQVLSKSQRLLSQKLLMSQQQIISKTSSNLLQVLIIWLVVVLFCTIGLWMTVVTQFTKQLNQVKQILGLLPLSIVKEIPMASRYINYILKKNQSC